ncbi:hypothetical protein EXIGLDRAFT_718432 [Exidia glandulosa HHB12029]|uniref:Uncharacterized protein n=1 Tax=Exidia glandulosa HHB12029 TaxID=1314781 RepID=A0A165HR49_EXIGL|nr:hypothetical protein EXIGLDRAFT_718432 [Exidia glandulosa HHB12029]
MAVVPRSQASAILSTGLSAATVALNVAGAAADAVPIAKQILNSAAHISAAAERIQKKRETMYLLVEKADIYATQIDIAVAGRVLDTSLQRRLARLYSVFLKIEELVDIQAGSKNNVLARVWYNVVRKPNRAETLVVKLEQEIQLFQLLTGIQLSLVVDNTARIVDDTARAVAADMRYDGQFRVLRDCDIDKRDIIERRETDEGTVVWASARVDGQLMVIRYFDSSSNAKRNDGVVAEVAQQRRTPYHEYLENVKKVSTIIGSHPHVVQLYGRHVQGPAAVFRSGTYPLKDHVRNMTATKCDIESSSAECIRLAYKIVDASFHLEDTHGLMWIGERVTIDEYGEPHIGLFDDIALADSEQQLPPKALYVCNDMFIWFGGRRRKETDVVDQVHDSHLHSTITQQLRDGNDTDSLQQVWDIIRREQLLVGYHKSVFRVRSGNLSLSHEMIARARRLFQMCASTPTIKFMEGVLLGDAATASPVRVDFWRNGDRDYLDVQICTYDGRHLRLEYFDISLPVGGPLSAKVLAAGLPGDFYSSDGSSVTIYQNYGRGDYSEYDTESGGSVVEYSKHDDGEALEDEHGVDDAEDSEKEGEDYETAQGNETGD